MMMLWNLAHKVHIEDLDGERLARYVREFFLGYYRSYPASGGRSEYSRAFVSDCKLVSALFKLTGSLIIQLRQMEPFRSGNFATLV